LFAANGFDNTSTDAILGASGASRGSLYHHFGDKSGLFDAALQTVHKDAVEQTRLAAQHCDDPLDALRAGCEEWIRLASQPSVRRIVLVDAPAVVGWERWRQIDEDHSLAIVERGLRVAAKRGYLPKALVRVTSLMLLASLNELALAISNDSDPARAEHDALAALNHLLDRLLHPD
jgi:AcrR family transcriptional regulator